MELRTTFSIESSKEKITYNDPVMFIGSCFASSIGSQLEIGHMPVMINPAGAVYNPVSVCNTLDTITGSKEFLPGDLHFYDGSWLSFYHYTDFSSEDPLIVLEKINRRSKEALSFLKHARFLFVTLGTARVYKYKASDLIVSNCHKMPADQFESKLLTVNEIVDLWKEQLNKLHLLYPQLQVVFTISPVRHWKDGAHGNQVSKSVLFVAVDELLKHKTAPQYFPVYELVMDDLRDYRFYDDDMLHPSGFAVNYLWEAFAGCYLNNNTINTWREVVKISKALNHRFNTESAIKKKDFAERILKQITDIKTKVKTIDLSREEDHFLKMRNM
jgi:GSCFA family